MKINNWNFLRSEIYGGKLVQTQVDGINHIVDAANKRSEISVPMLAYILATATHETARTMLPIDEYGKGSNRAYGQWIKNTKGDLYCWKNNRKTVAYLKSNTPFLFYGRGFVQLTWYDNYEKMSKYVGKDLIKNPELAKDLDTSIAIMIEGMLRGSFTGLGLKNFFTENKKDYVNARKIINGTDKAKEISKLAEKWESVISA